MAKLPTCYPPKHPLVWIGREDPHVRIEEPAFVDRTPKKKKRRGGFKKSPS